MIRDTTHLAVLIDERDEILEQLEIAETKYINSFKLSTPDPSIADFYPGGAPPPPPKDPPPVPPLPANLLSSDQGQEQTLTIRSPSLDSTFSGSTKVASPTPFITGQPYTLLYNGRAYSSGAVGLAIKHNGARVANVVYEGLTPLTNAMVVTWLVLIRSPD